MDFKTINPLWNLADPLTVPQAAALLAGVDPNAVRFNSEGGAWFDDPETGLTDSRGIQWVQTAFAGMTNAILAGNLKVKIVHDSRPIDNGDAQNLLDMMEDGELFSPGYEHVCGDDEKFVNGYFVKNDPNWCKTMVGVDSLRQWLASRGFHKGFFFPTASDAPDYLDPQNPRYAPKLAAVVRAWQAVADLNGKTPKQMLKKWLREHAAEFGMTDEEGNPYENGIEEAAKMANWQPLGGAPKTPG